MNFLKKPFVAVLLCVVMVLASTLISVDVKLGKACDNVTYSFYDGVRYQGQLLPSIADEIRELCSVTEEMIPIAKNYGIPTDQVSELCEDIKRMINSRDTDIDEVYGVYAVFYPEVKELENQLMSSGLSQHHSEAMPGYSARIAAAKDAVDSARYNENVTEFLDRNDHFPVNLWAELVGAEFPDYFS